jgi:multidrug efflux pump subunit AcrB
MNVSRWCINNPVATIVFFVVLTLGGFFAFHKTKVQLFPDLELPMIIVTATMPGAQPAQIETEIARKMENSLAGLQGLKHIYSTSRDGLVSITAEFRLERNPQEALDDVRQAISQIRSDLPADMEEPIVSKINVAGAPIAAYTISSSRMDAQALSWFVDDALKRRLIAVPGVGDITRIGGVTREIQIELQTERLQSLGLTAADVSQQLRALQMDLGAGRIKLGGADQTLRTASGTKTADDIARLPISTAAGATTLGQIASVKDTTAEVRTAAFLDGKPVVSIEVSRSKSASDVEVGAGVEAAMKDIQAAHPDLHFVKAFDFYTPIKDDFHASINLLLEGAALAVLVVWLFLRDWRATIVAATALPLSILPAALGLYLMGYTFNVPTLLALSLVIGILVDDAIVEVENIVRHMRMGKSPLEAAREAADEIGLAVIATTFTIIAVFLPTAFMTGVPGMMFKQFSLAAVFAVFASLVVARMLTPMMAAYIMRHVQDNHGKGDSAMLARYMRLVDWVVHNRFKTLLAALVFFVGSLMLVPMLPQGFIPADDNDQSQVHLELVPGTTIAQSMAAAEQARHLIVQNVPEVQSIYTTVGGGKAGQDGFLQDGTIDPRKATLTITLKPRGQRPKKQVVENKIRALMLQIPGARVKVGLGGSGERYMVMLTGEDPTTLASSAKAFEKELRTLKGIGNISSSAALVQPEVVLIPHLEKAAELGVSPSAIANTLRIATVGDYNAALPKLNTSARQVPIVVKLDDSVRADLGALARVTIPSAKGPIMLGQVADMQLGGAPAEINRYDRMRNVTYTIELAGASINEVSTAARQLPSIKNLPASVELRDMADAEVMGELFRDFGMAIGAGILCIYLVLILLFKNVLQPITILGALPLSIGGAFIALLATHASLSMPSLIGLLMLMGVTTKNSILLVEYAIMARYEQGMERMDALMDACHKRAMPIIMTTIAMAAGMLPVALGWSPADPSFRSPMAWTVIGGLVTSTVLSLVVIPATYLYMDDFNSVLLKWTRRGKRQLPHLPNDEASRQASV